MCIIYSIGYIISRGRGPTPYRGNGHSNVILIKTLIMLKLFYYMIKMCFK